ncbi:hypothetical protein D5274_03790 [bacterium 1XD42-94]|nr:hypothetical protein [bacterium 1XD42-76]NBK04301.1 hypothetical protein [bacterium 1XD42-94]
MSGKNKVIVLVCRSGFCLVLFLLCKYVCEYLNSRVIKGIVLSLAAVLGEPNSKRQLSFALSESFALRRVHVTRSSIFWKSISDHFSPNNSAFVKLHLKNIYEQFINICI